MDSEFNVEDWICESLPMLFLHKLKKLVKETDCRGWEAESVVAAASALQKGNNESSTSAASGDSDGKTASAICTRLLTHLLELGSLVVNSPAPGVLPLPASSHRILLERLDGINRELSPLLELSHFQPHALGMRKSSLQLTATCNTAPGGFGIEVGVVNGYLQEMFTLIEACVFLLPKPFLFSIAELVMGCASTKPLSKNTFGSTHLRLLEDSNTREILLKLFQQTHCVKNNAATTLLNNNASAVTALGSLERPGSVTRAPSHHNAPSIELEHSGEGERPLSLPTQTPSLPNLAPCPLWPGIPPFAPMPAVVPPLANPFGLGFIQALLASAQLLAATSAAQTQIFPPQAPLHLSAANGNPMFNLQAILPQMPSNLNCEPYEESTESPLSPPDSPPSKLARTRDALEASLSELHDTSGSDDLPNNSSNATEKRKQRKPFSYAEDCILIEAMKQFGTRWSEILRYGQSRGVFHERRLTTVKARCLYALRKMNASIEQLPGLSSEQLLAALERPINEQQTLTSFPHLSVSNFNSKPNDENKPERVEKLSAGVSATGAAASPLITGFPACPISHEAAEGDDVLRPSLRGLGRPRGRPRGSRGSALPNPRLNGQNESIGNAPNTSAEGSPFAFDLGAETLTRGRGRPGRPRGSRGLRPTARDSMPTMASNVSDATFTIFNLPLSASASMSSARSSELPTSSSSVVASTSLSPISQNSLQLPAVSPTTTNMSPVPALSCN